MVEEGLAPKASEIQNQLQQTAKTKASDRAPWQEELLALREKLQRYLETLHDRHGLLEKDATGRISWGFIHGNWALDNCRSDGRMCGVNNELDVLRETGCYADFTLPSAPSGAPGTGGTSRRCGSAWRSASRPTRSRPD